MLVISTEMIAEEKWAHRMAMTRADGLQNAPARPPQQDAPPCSKMTKKRSRVGCKAAYMNVATENVVLTMPGPNRNRAGIGGTEKSEAALLPHIFAFLQSSTSLNSITRTTVNQLGAAAIDVRAVFEPRQGHSRRLACPTGTEGTPVNVLGHISPKCLTKGIHAFYLALDKLALEQKLVSSSDALTVNIDISSFNEHAQLGVVLEMTFIKEDGWDACGQPKQKAVLRTICLNSLSVSDKRSVDIFKEDGSLFDKEVPCRLVMELALSGHLWDVMEHPCKFMGMDKGSECMGAGKGKKWARLRAALMGKGGPLEQIFGTRRAVHAALDGEHGPLLERAMQFLGADDRRKRFPVRPLPERTDTSGPVKALPFKLKILKRQTDTITKRKVVISSEVVVVESRISTAQSTLRFYSLVDMVPDGNYCDKHMIDRAAVAWTEVVKQPLGNVLKCISETRKMHNHLNLKNSWEKVVQANGSEFKLCLHAKVAEALGQERLKPLLERFSNGLVRQTEAVVSRWLMVQTTVTQMDFKRLMLVCLLVVDFAEGTEENKIKVLQDVCGTRGFVDEKIIRFKKVKVGTLFRFLISPVEILYMAVTTLIHTLAFQPLLAASAHRSECGTLSMRGLGSMVRVVDLILRRKLWVNMNMTGKRWSQNCRLGHRGIPTHECHGIPILCRRLERRPKNIEKDSEVEPRLLLHFYGSFYTRSMATVISRTINTISDVCRMKAADTTGVLSAKHRQLYPSKQDTFVERMCAAQFLVHHVAKSAADCILQKAAHAATDPLGMLAALCEVLPVQIQLNELEYCEDEDDEASTFYIATPQAIASANVLLVQLKELLLAHGPALQKVMNEPLKSLLTKEGMEELAEFAAAKEVPYHLRGAIVQPSSGPEWKSFPKPVTAIRTGLLAKLALIAAGRPTNINSVESRWSLLTTKFHGNVRNAGPMFMSDVFRKNDPKTSNLRPHMESKEFEKTYGDCRDFMRENEDSIKKIYRPNYEESRRKHRAEIKPQDHYADSQIGDLADKKDSGEIQPPKDKKPRRKREGRMTRNDETESEHSSESEQSEPEVDDEGSDSDAKSDSDALATDESYKGDRPKVDDKGSDASATHESQAPAVDSLEFDNDPGHDDSGEDPRSSGGSEADSSNGVAQADTAAVITNDRGSERASESECSRQLSARSQTDIEGTDSHIDSDPILPQSGQSSDDTAQGKISEQTEDRNDEGTDLADGFFEQEEEDDEDDRENIAHPFPNPVELSESAAQTASRWKLDYIWHLLKRNKWRDSEVSGPANTKTRDPVLTLKRLDGEKFPLTKCTNLFYVLFGDSGLELINIESIVLKSLDLENSDEMRSLFTSKKPEVQWCVKYTRCLHTQKAIECCTSRDTVVKNANGVNRPTSLGKKSLRKLLNDKKDLGLIFHKGDFPYETAAKNIVGFVGWDSAASIVADSDFKAVHKRINANLTQRTTGFQIQKPADMDWVYCGQDLSENVPRE